MCVVEEEWWYGVEGYLVGWCGGGSGGVMRGGGWGAECGGGGVWGGGWVVWIVLECWGRWEGRGIVGWGII